MTDTFEGNTAITDIGVHNSHTSLTDPFLRVGCNRGVILSYLAEGATMYFGISHPKLDLSELSVPR